MLYDITLLLLTIFYLRVVFAHVLPDSNSQESHRLLPRGKDVRRTVSQEEFKDLEELSRIVDISYCVGSTGVQRPFECLSHCREFKGFELLTTWHTGPLLSDSCGYLALSHPPFAKRIIVAFRGTYSIVDTIIDLSAYPQEYVPFEPTYGSKDDESDERKGDNKEEMRSHCFNCTVHAGFMSSWRNTRSIILSQVSAAMAQHPDYKVILVGHSLGGAVAALAGIEMHLRGWDPEVTTYGEPKIGNGGLVRFLDQLFGLDESNSTRSHSRSSHRLADRRWRYRRVTHVNDPVPLLPLAEWGYEMHGGEIFISRSDLPPSVSDLEFCEGNHDIRCISGDKQALDATINGLNLGLKAKSRVSRQSSVEQGALSDGYSSQSVLRYQHGNGDELQQSCLGLPWNLIPARYRLWELFLAHRDYFSRLGLCFTGGDPTGKGQ